MFKPGTVINEPIRNTIIAPSKKNRRLRSSVKRPAANASVIAFREVATGNTLLLDLAAGGFDSHPRTLGDFDPLESDSLFDFAGKHNFDALDVAANQIGVL